MLILIIILVLVLASVGGITAIANGVPAEVRVWDSRDNFIDSFSSPT